MWFDIITIFYQSSSVQINLNPLGYESKLESRKLNQIELIVIHCTELPDLETAREYGEKIHYDSGTGNSGHFYIDRDGSVHQWVSPERIAHHVANHNKQSLGIELVNKGRYPDWHNSRKQEPNEYYPDELIDSLVNLINHLHRTIPSLKHITGHEDLDQRMIQATDDPTQNVRRKIDPGPLFPWQYITKKTQLINIGSTAKKYE